VTERHTRRSRWRLTFVVAAAVATVAPTALAKDFGPGDLRVCNARRCVPIVDRGVVALLGPFYYSDSPPPAALPPELATDSFELRFSNGYATGIVATGKLDRFLSYGVHLGYFRPGVWYRLPPRISRELRRLTRELTPIPVTRAALARSR
jgi:hypothetical protein